MDHMAHLLSCGKDHEALAVQKRRFMVWGLVRRSIIMIGRRIL
jgi:hypothetical protein